jgi:hypothetical protein
LEFGHPSAGGVSSLTLNSLSAPGTSGTNYVMLTDTVALNTLTINGDSSLTIKSAPGGQLYQQLMLAA